ncbi:hypothetical protein [Candidatus Albibeggiatoa sp. nov. BB20]|uniref:hypothetical protein n=1 Tax=Candidatus Albibeggiatoa sp. nov. BB20 TaxID=3162723 RepID=UPI0033654C63
MNKAFLYFIVILYSLSLLWIEWQFSQSGVRLYVTDIKGDTFLYAIHTTLNMSLLWGTALLFLVSLQCIDKQKEQLFFYFALSQVLLFIYLGFDERFLIHEMAGRFFEVNDAYLLLLIGCAEAVILLLFGQLRQKSSHTLLFLGLASLLFLIMIVIDAKFPAKMQFRLSFEELSKLWASLFLFLFAWEILMQKIQLLKSRADSIP